ncbi:MAG: hypothetical protein LBR50_07835 [Tannerella sp.]|jgi:hypothetical protein|nr:hypothetical protein [Tannerella sp.]
MNTLKCILSVILLAGVSACNSGIDPITPVDAGNDVTPPEVTISYPLDGSLIQVVEDVATVVFKIEVVDDIEISEIVMQLDGASIATFNSFKDYRRAVENFTYSNVTNGEHTLTVTATDLSGKSASRSVGFEKVPPYKPKFDGEIFYMPFDGDFSDLVSITAATVTGAPSTNAEGVSGKAYAGALDSYLTFPTEGLLGSAFTAAFWYKLNTNPDRAGILTVSPVDAANPTAQNNRVAGFRFFREGSADSQTFKLNVGDGVNEYWFDGGEAASLAPDGQWVHLAFTITGSESAVYINGEAVSKGANDGIGWDGCDIMTIASGAPRYTGWSHLSDYSLMDELRIFNKALTQTEIKALMTAK